MGLVLAIIGATAGRKAGEARPSYFALISVVAVIPTGLNMTVLGPRLDALMVVSAWIAAFSFLAVPSRNRTGD